MGVIDYRDSRAIYEQIALHFERLILRGVMQEDEQMPSVRALATELATNPNTVQKSYRRLEADGFIYSVKGRGNYVCNAAELVRRKREELVQRFGQLIRESKALELDPRALFEEAGRKDAPSDGRKEVS
ncbi:MAG: GntR family transcriptional regulator [Lachnospiraceae bacterium]|nr:GntR family transcriptional regulator [Lachnospiraceae bacterium]